MSIDTSQPGRITVAYFTDSKISLGGVTYNPWRSRGNLSLDLAYLHATDGSQDQFLGTAAIYKTKIGHAPDGQASYVAFGFGVKGWQIGGANAGAINVKRDGVFGIGFSFNMGAP